MNDMGQYNNECLMKIATGASRYEKLPNVRESTDAPLSSAPKKLFYLYRSGSSYLVILAEDAIQALVYFNTKVLIDVNYPYEYVVTIREIDTNLKGTVVIADRGDWT